MTTGEALYLAMVILAVLIFMAALAWVTYTGKSQRHHERKIRSRRNRRRAHSAET